MIQLKNICTKIGSGATPTGGKSAYLSQGISLIRSQNVLDYTFAMDGLAYINEDQAMKLNNVEVQKGDILLNITGDSVARVCIVPDNVLPARVNQHVAIIRVDKDKADNNYVLYSLIKSKKSLLSLAGGGATRNALTKKMIEEFEIELPQLSIQKKISAQLSEIDDKIAVNRRICENLEAQTQALFKHWFIDFAPFKNGKFVESELGMIPEGWRVGRADDFYTINIGKTPPRAERQWFSESRENNKIWISISDMGGCGVFISDSKEYLTPEAQSKFNVVMVPVGTVLLSFKLTLGRVAIADAELTTNEAIARFILPNSDYREYTYLYLKQFKYGSLGSTSSIATAVNSKIIKAMPFLMPSKEIIKDFSNKAGKLFDEIKNLNQESSRLSTLRDTLLPKLMSGQIKL